jgi:tetratricopeptide (TPR) repeat protein
MKLTTAVLEQHLAQAIRWIRGHQEQFWAILGVTVLSGVFVILLLRNRRTANEEGWVRLGAIQGQIMQGQTDAPRKALEEWTQRFAGTSASSYAQFMKADLLYKTSDYVGASQIYGELTQTGRPEPVKPLALSAQVASEEMAGRIPQAQALAQTFIERYPDHFLAAPMYLSQARLSEMAGNLAAAAAIYERFLLLYPQSPWTAFARARQQALGPTPTTPPVAK